MKTTFSEAQKKAALSAKSQNENPLRAILFSVENVKFGKDAVSKIFTVSFVLKNGEEKPHCRFIAVRLSAGKIGVLQNHELVLFSIKKFPAVAENPIPVFLLVFICITAEIKNSFPSVV